jgi:hypothetical protein
MKTTKAIIAHDIRIHEMNAQEFCALCDAENLVLQLANAYPEGTVLVSPNTGECVMVDELRRVAGILGFLTDNRVVEVNH